MSTEPGAAQTLAFIFVLALINIAFEVYLHAALRRAEVSHTAAPDPATAGLGARRPPPVRGLAIVATCYPER